MIDQLKISPPVLFLQIFDGEDPMRLPLFESCFAEHKRPTALLSSGNTMRLEYQHWSKFLGYPAFKAHYYFVNDGYWRHKPIGKIKKKTRTGQIASFLTMGNLLKYGIKNKAAISLTFDLHSKAIAALFFTYCCPI